MKINLRDEAGVSIVAVSGELDASSAADLEKAIDRLLAEGRRSVLVSLGEVGFIDSAGLATLVKALKRVRNAGYVLANIDASLILAAPKIGPHAAAIRTRVAELLGLHCDCVGLKAKTPEGLNFENAALAHVVVLLENAPREKNATANKATRTKKKRRRAV